MESSKAKVYAVRIQASHTPSGNPRRCWLVYNSKGTYLTAIDEGYQGHAALSRPFPKAETLTDIPTNATFYNQACLGRKG